MQTTDGNNENIPTSPSQLSPILQISKHEPLSPQSPSPKVSIQGPQNSTHDLSSQLPLLSQSQNSNQAHFSSSSSSLHNSMNASHSVIPTTTTNMSNSMSPPPKNPLCGPLLPEQLSSSSTRIPWPLMPLPQQPPLCHQPSTMPLFPPMGMPPPFPYFPVPFPLDQFYHPTLPRNINNASNGQIYSQPWSTGLFDCFDDIKNCFITCICPCVTFGQVDEILSEGQMTWWEAALMFGLVELLCCQASFIFAWYHRLLFRKKYNLMGNLFSELAITLCCMRLVLCQNYRQLNKLGFDVALGWKANKKKRRRISSQAAVQFVPPMANPGMLR
ncbi:cell number regulator 1-like [Capsicum chacoense]